MFQYYGTPMNKPDFLNPQDIRCFLNILKEAKDNRSIESYIYIKNILNSIEFAIPFTKFSKDYRFVRTRVHSEGEDFFTNISDLSHRKDVQNIKIFGRANEPGQSFFYCSNNDSLSLFETSEIARKQENKQFEYSSG